MQADRHIQGLSVHLRGLSFTRVLALLASEHPKVYEALTAEDRRIIDGVGPIRPSGR